MLARDGLEPARARRAAAEIASDPEVLLRTMVEKELGLAAEADIQPARGALILSGALAIAALVPLVPYMFFTVHTALVVSVVASAIALFALGVVKARWTRGGAIRSGLEIVALVAAASGGGFIVGTLLPHVLGFEAPM
jgi:predicted membrane protein (TIGR00267 family)